ncbi:hypothetical protein DTO013E5_6824 [Penicillium roqueforti]|uniref:Threonine/serine exporter-like N-terminal domain-containing protein n=1 Tax=Penicillium roqueforti (strain FM164) TaxID=1365484 RepID=W6QK51_PENRF|nr:uncharacterized protein LCP9604111_8222 [Penicillium roqueforti]CDM36376.1 Domain of unknown function DUF3815 [Penicillium roqueforti FM164]KAF9241949.1 hypothetical protein LCP9604111_8222 [Penicillium roqueforti]KAI2679819.1 hypothetical protein CBS147355_4301 [Penicillium roqueforti]KAI2684266.1 hypothetical protein LCP963914a_5566 [Penicillium roqueforti]KAI2697441.1 hypothetical protein CBS147372_7801 [Penicillium roqueforti]
MSDAQEKAPPIPPHPSAGTAEADRAEGSDHNVDSNAETLRPDEAHPEPETLYQRCRAAGRRIRNRAVIIAEMLGRPHEKGDGLNSPMLPDYYETLDDIRAYEARQALDEEARLPGTDYDSQARLLMEQMGSQSRLRRPHHIKEPCSGSTTPGTPGTPDESAGPGSPPGGLLSHLLRVYADNLHAARLSSMSTASEPSPDAEPKPDAEPIALPDTTTGEKKDKSKWYNHPNKPSHNYASSLVNASMDLCRVALPGATGPPPATPNERKKENRKGKKNIKLTVHIAAILARQQYIMQLCRALMRYGAPTHRLEEYMMMTSNVLDIKAQFMYIPGCMFMSFDDQVTRTTEVKIVRVVQGLDLSRLAEVHNVYKHVVHDIISVEKAIHELDQIMQRKPRYNRWLLILLTGLASVTVGPYSFSARPIDLPIIFMLGCLVGFMQYVVAPISATYSNVLEVTVAILVSFISRAFGSIQHNGERVFCFSAMVQSSIAMILPGFAVLSSSLELQSHQMNAGSIRLVFTIIYSLFLGYGVTVGTTIYGLMDKNATNEATCSHLPEVWGNEYIQHFPFVALFCLFAGLINQSKPRQLPVTIFMGMCGYIANYFSTKKLGANQVANTVGAFTIGLLANLYSRVWHGHAAAAIIPGIFTLVPSGLASSGSIISGLQYAEAVAAGDATNSAASNSSLTALGYGMIQTAIGISVGLFISDLIVYPHGKKRSGIFSL